VPVPSGLDLPGWQFWWPEVASPPVRTAQAVIFLFSMVHTTTAALPPREVLARAKAFFAERVPNSSAYPEKEGPTFLVLRGQGGEEVTLSAVAADGGARIRASTLFFDQALDRFLSTLPLTDEVRVA